MKISALLVPTLREAPADAEIAGRIRSDFERFARALDASVGRELVDAETRRALEALGYAEPRGAPPEH